MHTFPDSADYVKALIPSSELRIGDLVRENGAIFQVTDIKAYDDVIVVCIQCVVKGEYCLIPAHWISWTLQGNGLRLWYVLNRERT